MYVSILFKISPLTAPHMLTSPCPFPCCVSPSRFSTGLYHLIQNQGTKESKRQKNKIICNMPGNLLEKNSTASGMKVGTAVFRGAYVDALAFLLL